MSRAKDLHRLDRELKLWSRISLNWEQEAKNPPEISNLLDLSQHGGDLFPTVSRQRTKKTRLRSTSAGE